MTSTKTDDPIVRVLASLPSPTPPVAQGERVRARCHAALARRRQKASRHGVVVARVCEATFLLGVAIYLAGAVTEAWRLGSAL